MFRYTGPRRTFQHNLRLAIVLSGTAGFVNAAGLVAFNVLTTNITGHAALLATDSSLEDWQGVRLAAVCLGSFFAGGLFSAWYIGFRGRDTRYVYVLPLLIEVAILLYVALYGYTYDGSPAKIRHFAASLLFAMGMQNALVSIVSGAVVRTTHLTGIVTDFGIALAEAIRKRFRMERQLRRRLLLHINIISFFLFGGVWGVLFFLAWGYHSFFISAGLVLFALFFDAFRKSVLKLRDRVRSHQRKMKTRLKRNNG